MAETEGLGAKLDQPGCRRQSALALAALRSGEVAGHGLGLADDAVGDDVAILAKMLPDQALGARRLKLSAITKADTIKLVESDGALASAPLNPSILLLARSHRVSPPASR